MLTHGILAQAEEELESKVETITQEEALVYKTTAEISELSLESAEIDAELEVYTDGFAIAEKLQAKIDDIEKLSLESDEDGALVITANDKAEINGYLYRAGAGEVAIDMEKDKSFMDNAKGFVAKIWARIKNFFSIIGRWISNVWTKVVAFFSKAPARLKKLLEAANSRWKSASSGGQKDAEEWFDGKSKKIKVIKGASYGSDKKLNMSDYIAAISADGAGIKALASVYAGRDSGIKSSAEEVIKGLNLIAKGDSKAIGDGNINDLVSSVLEMGAKIEEDAAKGAKTHFTFTNPNLKFYQKMFSKSKTKIEWDDTVVNSAGLKTLMTDGGKGVGDLSASIKNLSKVDKTADKYGPKILKAADKALKAASKYPKSGAKIGQAVTAMTMGVGSTAQTRAQVKECMGVNANLAKEISKLITCAGWAMNMADKAVSKGNSKKAKDMK